jgi:hypothetical protein
VLDGLGWGWKRRLGMEYWVECRDSRLWWESYVRWVARSALGIDV